MKLSSIIIGLLSIEAIKTSTDEVRVYNLDLFKEIKIDYWDGTYFFRVPSYKDDYMQIVLNCYSNTIDPQFTVRVTGFPYYPSDEEIIHYSQWYYPSVPRETVYKYSDQYWAYIYSFPTIQEKYLGISVTTGCSGLKIDMYVKALGHVYRADLSSTINLGDFFGQYYFTFPSYSKDDMAIEVKVYKPFYEEVTPFDIEISRFSFIEDYSAIKGPDVVWTNLPLDAVQSYRDYDIYRYPFSTSYNENYLGFYFGSLQHFKVDIYKYSRKGNRPF